MSRPSRHTRRLFPPGHPTAGRSTRYRTTQQNAADWVWERATAASLASAAQARLSETGHSSATASAPARAVPSEDDARYLSESIA